MYVEAAHLLLSILESLAIEFGTQVRSLRIQRLLQRPIKRYLTRTKMEYSCFLLDFKYLKKARKIVNY